jgi:hypothetical protein
MPGGPLQPVAAWHAKYSQLKPLELAFVSFATSNFKRCGKSSLLDLHINSLEWLICICSFEDPVNVRRRISLNNSIEPVYRNS